MFSGLSSAGRRALVVSVLAGTASSALVGDRDYPGRLTLSPGQTWIVDLRAGRLDHDELCDVVATTAGTRLAIYLGTSKGELVPHSFVDLPGRPDRLALGDVDADGALDVACSVGAELYVSLGRGDGTFMPPLAVDSFQGVRRIECDDVDGDGRDDLVVLFDSFAGVRTYLATGSGSFAAPIESPLGVDVRDFVLADLDSDGSLDVALADLAQKRILLAFGDGSGSFTQSGFVSTDPVAVTMLLAGRMDTDDSIDLIAGSFWSGGTWIYHNDGAGGFSAPVLLYGGNPLLAADWNSDGRGDLLSGFGAPQLTLSAGHGFARSVRTPLPNSTSAARACDVDGDGLLDLVFAARSYNTTGSWEEWTSVGTLLGDCKGGFQGYVPTLVPQGLGKYEQDIMPDIDGDGDADLVTRVEGTGTVKVHRGTGRGGFEEPEFLECSATVHDLAVLDHDGNGKASVLAFTFLRPQVHHFDQGPTGFAAPVVSKLPAGSTRIGRGDWNGDGLTDLIVNAWGIPMQVLFARSDGSFDDLHPTDIPTATGGLFLFTGSHFDGDGRADLIVGTTNGGVRGYRGLGNGSFVLAWDLGTSLVFGLGAVADLDSDGLDDVVLHPASGGPAEDPFHVSVYLADGMGGLRAPTTHFLGQQPVALWAVDMDGDGHRDIAAPLYLGETSFLFGNGRGGFERAQLHATGFYYGRAGQIEAGGPLEILLDFTYDRELMSYMRILRR